MTPDILNDINDRLLRLEGRVTEIELDEPWAHLVERLATLTDAVHAFEKLAHHALRIAHEAEKRLEKALAAAALGGAE